MPAGKDDFTEWSCAERRGFLRLVTHDTKWGSYETGEFMHPNGIVCIYREGDNTSLQFMHGDRMFTRQWERNWGKRTINKLARQFVSDIFAGIIK